MGIGQLMNGDVDEAENVFMPEIAPGLSGVSVVR